MSHELNFHLVTFIEFRFKWQDHGHFIDEAANGLDATASPCPDLRADVIEYLDPVLPGQASQQKIEIRKIDEHNQPGGLWAK